jgi:hypothetical protein
MTKTCLITEAASAASQTMGLAADPHAQESGRDAYAKENRARIDRDNYKDHTRGCARIGNSRAFFLTVD